MEVEDVVSGRVREVGAAVVRVVEGVTGAFLATIGLLAVGRAVVVEGAIVVRRAGVAATDFKAEVRSEVVDANDILFGFADMPSLLFSSPDGLSSTVLSDSLFLWVPMEEVEEWPIGLRTVDVVAVGLAGGLLSEPPRDVREADEVVVGLVVVESLGAAVLVTGFAADGVAVFGFKVVVSSFLSMIAEGIEDQNRSTNQRKG